MVIETAKAIKNINQNIKIYVGGTNAMTIYKRFLITKYFDGVCLTEGELIFPRMILEGIENTPGWAYLKDDKIIVNDVDDTCFTKHLDDLPMPAWTKLPLNRYDIRDVTNHGNKDLISAILTSRGCRFHCAYCHISGKKKDIGKLRLHSINRIISEVKELKKLGITRIYLEDDSLLSMKDRTKELFKLVENEGIKFLGINGVNLIDFFDKTIEINGKWKIETDFIKMLYKAGFYQMAFPVESGSQRVINKYCSGKIQHDKMDLISLMKVLLDVGVKTPVNLIIGFPDETEEEIQKTIDIGKKLKEVGAPYISFFFATPYPGTKLYDIALEMNCIDTIDKLNTDLFNWKHPVMKNTVVSAERLIEIQKQANIECNSKEFIEYIEGKTIRKLT